MAQRSVVWMGSSRSDIKSFPREVRSVMAYALWLAETGGKHPDAKPLQGFGGAGVVEMVDDYDGDSYRTVYTLTLADTVYVLHAFQKKSKQAAATPQRDLDLIRRRLKLAEERHASGRSRR